MRKILIIGLTVLAIILAITGGYYTVQLVKLMGANLLTIRGVMGCYIMSFFVVGILWVLIITKIEN